MNATSQYPLKIWNGLTPNPRRSDRDLQLVPNHNDWDQVVVEVIATQQRVEQLSLTIIQLGRLTPLDIESIAGETLYIGQPVYVNQANARLFRARAAFEVTSRVCGFCKADVTLGSVIGIVSAGRLELSDWSIPLGGTGLLIPGAIYYLDGVSGQISVNPPATGFTIQVGIAVTTTILDIDIKTRLRL
jgi:hypothetical protein